MSGFIDAPPSDKIYLFGFTATPRFNTNITAAASGAERRTANWSTPLHRFAAPGAVDCTEKMLAVKEMWMALFGPLYSFPLRDPLDFASRDILVSNRPPVVGRTDQFLGTGNGTQTDFQLLKSYTFGSQTMRRPIYKPVVASTVIGVNGFDPTSGSAPGGPYTVTVNRMTGIVNFAPAPAVGVVLTAGYLFDCEVRFEADDSFDQISRAFGVSGQADLVFMEIPPC